MWFNMKNIRIPFATLLMSCAYLALGTTQSDSTWISELAKAGKQLDRTKYAWASQDSRPKKSVKPRSNSDKGILSSNASGTLKVEVRDSGIYVFDGGSFRKLDGEEAERYLVAMKARHLKVGRAEELTHSGDLAAARAALIPLVREAPYDEVGLRALAEVCLRQESYHEALALLAPILTANASEETILYAAYASAMTGQIYPGLKDYCDRVSTRMMAGLDGGGNAIPVGTDRKASTISVNLAMGAMHAMQGDDQSARPYFERTLKFDPKNPWAGFSLGAILARKGLLKEAARAYSISVANAAGSLKRIAQQELSSVKYRLSQGG